MKLMKRNSIKCRKRGKGSVGLKADDRNKGKTIGDGGSGTGDRGKAG